MVCLFRRPILECASEAVRCGVPAAVGTYYLAEGHVTEWPLGTNAGEYELIERLLFHLLHNLHGAITERDAQFSEFLGARCRNLPNGAIELAPYGQPRFGATRGSQDQEFERPRR